MTGKKAITIMGICQGGTFSIIYAALHPEKVKNLVTMVTPVDFHTPKDTLSLWARNLDVDALVDNYGIFRYGVAGICNGGRGASAIVLENIR